MERDDVCATKVACAAYTLTAIGQVPCCQMVAEGKQKDYNAKDELTKVHSRFKTCISILENTHVRRLCLRCLHKFHWPLRTPFTSFQRLCRQGAPCCRLCLTSGILFLDFATMVQLTMPDVQGADSGSNQGSDAPPIDASKAATVSHGI